MKFIRYPTKGLKQKPSVVTIGNFDGVHIGHQALIRQVVDLATEQDLQSSVVSMQPLASQYFGGKDKIAVLTPFKCKFKLIAELGIDNFCVLNFNQRLSKISAHDFIQEILLDGLNARHIIVGDDFRFGKNRTGDFEYLQQYCKKLGVTVSNINTVSLNDLRISSSTIRQSISESQFDVVKSYLGRRFSIAGKISKGQQLGRTLDFPTINLKMGKRVLPMKGIFCVRVVFGNGQKYQGAASIGTRPTVNGTSNILEVHLLDFNKQVYGRKVEVFFYHKLRNEVKFDSLDELKRHIKDDVIKTRLYFDNKL